MGLSAAQIQKAADLKQSLLRAAAQIILRAGVQALTLEAVAKQAGASKGAMLHHFRSKSELLEALMDDLIARFEAERQALALMDHPSIAKVLDAGATETGRPYFVMELVKGVPITDYCDPRRLTIRQRIERRPEAGGKMLLEVPGILVGVLLARTGGASRPDL